MKKINIIGGGVIGLVCALIASKSGYDEINIIEKSNKFGGLIRTFDVGNNKLEIFYHHFFTHDNELKWLLNELELEKKLLFNKTIIGFYTNSRFYNFSTPFDLIKFDPMSNISKIKFLLGTYAVGKFMDWRKYENIAATEWFDNWIGKETCDVVWRPLLKSKFGEEYDKIPLSWMIGRIQQRLNSRKMGSEQLGYIYGSTQIILDKILQDLNQRNVNLLNNQEVKDVIITNGSLSKLILTNGEIEGGEFLFTSSCQSISRIFKDKGLPIEKKLNKIESIGACVVVLELKKRQSNIYWLNVAESESPIGGVIEHTNLVDPSEYSGSHIVYLSKYFSKRDKLFKMNNDEIKTLMLEHYKKINFNLRNQDIKSIHVFKSNEAAILTNLNFSNKVLNFHTEIKNMFIANMMHIYPDERSINNSVKIALKAMKALGNKKIKLKKSNSLSGLIGFD